MGASPPHLVLHPDPVLREPARVVDRFDDELHQLVSEMKRLMVEHEGVGLAAPQVGRPLRIFICNSQAEGEEDGVFINPEIIETGGSQEWAEEGCLSLPGIHGRVRRPSRVCLRAQDLQGEPFEVESEEFLARIWQHELDHLDGVLIIDRMRPIDRIAARRALKELVSRSTDG